jgi:hypothetical protein
VLERHQFERPAARDDDPEGSRQAESAPGGSWGILPVSAGTIVPEFCGSVMPLMALVAWPHRGTAAHPGGRVAAGRWR